MTSGRRAGSGSGGAGLGESSPRVGIAWYSRQDWERLREIVDDPENLEETYEEWLEMAEAAIDQIRASGYRPETVPIAVDALVAWCDKEDRDLTGEARAEFAAELLAHQAEREREPKE